MDKRIDPAARAIEFERAQIGHEIHDALLPLIFAASASISSLIDAKQKAGLDPVDLDPKTLDRLTQVATWLDDAMQTGRRLLCGIYPPELTTTTWPAAAATAVERLLGPKSSIVRWELDSEVEAFEPDAALAAYRIVIEAIRNAARHGRATSVIVRSSRQEDRWRIEISDDGIGFEPTDVPEDRFGLRSMRARAKLLGGNLSIQSSAGGPTIITLQL